MIVDVKRAYIPRCESARNAFFQRSLAQIQAFNGPNGTFPNQLCPVRLNPSLPHRKIWAYIFSVSATWSVDCDFVFTLNGTEIYRQPLFTWQSPATNGMFTLGWAAATSQIGTANESMAVLIGATAAYMASPHRLNITADAAHIDVRSLTGGAALFDGTLMIQSQAGL